MSKGRYILRYRGEGPIPSDHAERIRDIDGLNLIDSTPRMMLVEATGREELEQVVGALPEWVMSEERVVERPDPRPKIRKQD